MATSPSQKFLLAVAKSKLIDTQTLKRAVERFRQAYAGKRPNLQMLAAFMVQHKLLTTWQIRKISQGKYKGFFLGKYKLLNLLGSGGMSQVYLAEHVVMRRRVALKILPQDLVNDPEYLQKFYDESRATAALDHPNIVRAYDVDNEGKVHYLVMEYVEGSDLQQIVEEKGPIAPNLAADYIRQAADGLEHAHERKIVHRDIKPANLLVAKENDALKILDMGLALLSNYAAEKDEGDDFFGTTDYLSPEQATNSPHLDGRSDIYSLGCTFYFMLTGSPPFPDGTMAEVLLKHQMSEPKAISTFRDDVNDGLIAICSKMMAKAPEERYQSAHELSEELGQWLLDNDASFEIDPSVTGMRSEEDAEQMKDFMAQVQRDHRETTPAMGSDTQQVLMQEIEEDAQQDPADESLQISDFLANLEGGSGSNLGDSDASSKDTASFKGQETIKRGEEKGSSSTGSGPNRSAPARRPPPGSSQPRRRPPPPKKTSKEKAKEKSGMDTFLNQLNAEHDSPKDAANSDDQLQSFLKNLDTND
ncbi:Serine/threonine-protein kinase PknB [Planctomycetales bacterium 10988]|nr:Serine/threonine-protein kinase PknB [Planctomycetales bacterium 10988]